MSRIARKNRPNSLKVPRTSALYGEVCPHCGEMLFWQHTEFLYLDGIPPFCYRDIRPTPQGLSYTVYCKEPLCIFLQMLKVRREEG